jgi:hypothetical protein
MTAFVKETATAAGLHVTFKDDPDYDESGAYPDASEVVVPVIRQPIDFLVALHELGHCLSPEATAAHRRQDPYSAVISEGAAWAWAAASMPAWAKRSIRRKDYARAAELFGSHLSWAFKEPRRPFPMTLLGCP